MATVLVIEDEPTILMLAESVLQHAGYETLTACTLAEAQAILNSDQPLDLIFTDIQLGPEADAGIEIGQTTKQTRAGTPIVYASARALTDGMKSLLVEPSSFLPKPYTDEQIIKSVSDLLRAKR